jgi:hypothetical protein
MSSYRILQFFIAALFLGLSFVSHIRPDFLAKYKFNTKLKYVFCFFGFSLLAVTLRQWFYVLPFALQILFFTFLWFVFTRFFSLELFKYQYVLRFTKYHLAYLRILICSVLLMLTYLHDITTTLIVPTDYITYYQPLGILFETFPDVFQFRSFDFLWWLRASCFVFLTTSILGFKTKWSLTLAAISYTFFYYIIIIYTHFFHSGFMPLQLLYLLILLPCGDVLSIDNKFSPKERNQQVYGYSVLVFLATYVLFYMATGLSKLYVDPFWANHYNLKKFILEDCLDMIGALDLNLAAHYIQAGFSKKLFIFIGLAGVFVEFLAPLLLFFPRFLLIGVLSILSLHLGIYLMQEFLFEDAVLLSFGLLPFYFFWSKSKLLPEQASVVPQTFKIKLIGGFFASLICTAWICGWHYFPIASTWGMYAVDTNKTEGASYSKVYLVLNDGERVRTDLTDHITFAIGGKWRNLTEHPRSIKVEYVERLKKLYKNYAVLYNNDKPIEKQISHVEVELWLWWHFAEPNSPTFGNKRDDVIKVELNDNT